MRHVIKACRARLQAVRLGAQQHQALEEALTEACARRRLVHDHRPKLAVVAYQHNLQRSDGW